MTTTLTISRKRNWNRMETYQMQWMRWMMQNIYWILATWTRMTVKTKWPTPTPKPKQNTHPTHIQVGGWGLQPLIFPIGVDVFCCCCCFHCVFTTPWQLGGCFWCIHVFYMRFWSIGVCVWNVFFFPK